MSTSTVLCQTLIFIGRDNPLISTRSSYPKFSLHFTLGRRRRVSGFASNAKKKGKKSSTRKRSWWQNFFFEEEGNWLGLKDDDMIEAEAEAVVEAELSDATGDDEGLSEGEKFEAWKRRAEAIVELREAQEDMLNEESRRWEDWIVDYDGSTNGSWWSQGSDGIGNGNGNGNGNGVAIDGVNSDPTDLVPEKGFVESVRDLVLGKDEEDMLYEDRVFQYASSNSAKFLAVLIIIPWALDFAVHDYVLMPFLDRYVKTVPLAAQMLDVRKSQKLEMVKDLKVESARLRFEMEIGKSPSLSDEEVWWELRHKALDLRDEWRLENRRAFANIWSDMLFGISLFILLFFNQSKVALLKFTGYKIVNNVSDTGKAFLIILLTDIFLGYHSESGWQTLLEVIVEHYGLQVDQSAITIFISVIPVVIDACVKLWLFKFLPRLSPRVANLFQEMTRH